mgnify:FL=1
MLGLMTSYDPETVRFFDVAHEGAQARVVASAVPDLARVLSGMRPRSLVILAADQIARAAAHVAVGLAEPADVPIVVSESLPRFTGALDIVVVAGESPWAERALHDAARRGATTVLIDAMEDAPEDTIVIDALPTTEGASPVRAITALHAVQAVLSEDPELVARRLEDVADAVDREVDALSPQRDTTTNPGRALREFAEGGRVIHSSGVDRYAFSDERTRVDLGALVARMAGAIWAVHGLGGTVVDAEGVGPLLQDAPTDIFYDPFEDEEPLVPLKIVLWGQEEANLPHSFAAASADPDCGDVARALQLITRSYAATAYDVK